MKYNNTHIIVIEPVAFGLWDNVQPTEPYQSGLRRVSKVAREPGLGVAQLGVVLQSKRSPVQFLVRAHAWVAVLSSVKARARGNWSMFLSLSFSLPSPLSKK